MDENDILLKEIIDVNQNVQDALILLKIWFTQKNLSVCFLINLLYICIYSQYNFYFKNVYF